MRSTRSKYRYAIRYVKKNEEMLRKNAMAKSISENNSRDLWKEVYKVRSKCKTSSQCMDGVSGNESISELFAHKYNVLYNSVCSNTTQLNELLALNENDIITNCSNNNTSLINKHTHHVSVDQLQNAIHKLKSSKSDCTDQLFSDHFICTQLLVETIEYYNINNTDCYIPRKLLIGLNMFVYLSYYAKEICAPLFCD